MYDLTNCGPRSRFVIATEDGPLIVHNCENWTQATATGVWGIIGDAMLRAEAAGYAIVMETYDELVCEVPDDDRFTTEGLCSIISERPWWADERLPLAAEGFEAYRYRK